MLSWCFLVRAGMSQLGTSTGLVCMLVCMLCCTLQQGYSDSGP